MKKIIVFILGFLTYSLVLAAPPYTVNWENNGLPTVGTSSGNVHTWNTTASQPGTGTYGGDFILTKSMPTIFRTEWQVSSSNAFNTETEYWIGLSYKHVDWAFDDYAEMAPFQIHEKESISGTCSGGSAVSRAPFYALSQKGKFQIRTHGGIIRHEETLVPGVWHNYVFNFKLSTTTNSTTGFIKAWKDGVLLFTNTGKNYPATDGCNVALTQAYLKFGIYKWDWKDKQAQATRRQIYIDNVKTEIGANKYSLVATPVDGGPPPTDTTAPTVSNRVCTPSITSINCTWTTNEAASSRISNPNVAGQSFFSATLVTSHNVTLTGLTANTTYPIKIQSVDAAGNTSADNIANVTTLINNPPVISNKVISVGKTQTKISLSTDIASTVVVSYGLTTDYELGSFTTTSGTSHGVTLPTLTENTLYHYQIKATSTNGAITTDTDAVFTTLPAALQSDDFTGTVNTALWTLYTPVAGPTLTSQGTKAQINVPAGTSFDLWTSLNQAPRLRQTSLNTDLEVIAKIDSTTNTSTQVQGLTFEQDDTNFIRFNAQTALTNPTTTTRFFASTSVANTHTARIDQTVAIVAPYWLKIARSGNNWTLSYSANGTTFTPFTSFAHTITLGKVGIFAGSISPGHTALFDTFTASTTAPPPPVDTTPPVISAKDAEALETTATIFWTTDEPSDSTVVYTKDGITNLTEYSAAMATSHTVNLTGLTPSSTYTLTLKSKDAAGNEATDAFSITTSDIPPGIGINIGSVQVTESCLGTGAKIKFSTDIPTVGSIEYGTSQSLGTLVTGVNLENSHEFDLTGLSPGTKYYFKAIADAGNSVVSETDIKDFQYTSVAKRVDTLPPIISNIVTTATTGGATITFQTNEPATKTVRYGTVANGTYTGTTSDNTLVRTHSLTLTGLTSGVQHQYRITAIDASGNTTRSINVVFTPL